MRISGRIDPTACSLYFHIPFCAKKCHYCHFYVIPENDRSKKILLDGLKKEWTLRLPWIRDKNIASIYFGGGTPSLMGAESIAEILSWVFTSIKPQGNPIEITLEANPEDITFNMMQSYAQAGINRISIGLQALQDPLLIQLGRLHNSQKAIEAVHLTHQAGIGNITVDLMYDLPGQTLSMWYETLAKTILLPITHLSLYNMTIEPRTQFFKWQNAIRKQLPDPDTSLQMYTGAIQQLNASGLKQYEISAFAKNDQWSHHNVRYWKGCPFLGFGPSAFSYWDGKRFSNIDHLGRYDKALKENLLPISFEEELDEDRRRGELLAIGLRLLEGIDLLSFQQQHGMLSEKTKRSLQTLENQRLIHIYENIACLSLEGMLFYDSVAVDLI